MKQWISSVNDRKFKLGLHDELEGAVVNFFPRPMQYTGS